VLAAAGVDATVGRAGTQRPRGDARAARAGRRKPSRARRAPPGDGRPPAGGRPRADHGRHGRARIMGGTAARVHRLG